MIKKLLLTICLCTTVWADPFTAAGRWKIFHSDGAPILVTLNPDHSARNDWQNGTRGHWSWVGERLVMRWKDGWRDVITLKDGRFEKLGYAPGNRNLKAPDNHTAAYQLDPIKTK